jgi:hypothetical protein
MGSSMNIKEKRKTDRFVYEIPESVYVELKVRKEPEKKEFYDLKVKDCSRHGLGMLITQKDFGLLNVLKKGDTIQDISFFATWSVFKIDGTVQHKTKIEEGEYKGCYILGIKSQDVISNCRPEYF